MSEEFPAPIHEVTKGKSIEIGPSPGSVVTEFFIHPPLAQVNEKTIGRTILGSEPYGVHLEFEGSTLERSMFTLTVPHEFTRELVYANPADSDPSDVSSIVAARLNDYANGIQGPVELRSAPAFYTDDSR